MRNSPGSNKKLEIPKFNQSLSEKIKLASKQERLVQWHKDRPKTALDKQKNNINSILNKLVESNFDNLLSELLKLHIEEIDVLKALAETLCSKASFEHKFSSIYAKLCLNFANSVGDIDVVDNEHTYKKDRDQEYND